MDISPLEQQEYEPKEDLSPLAQVRADSPIEAQALPINANRLSFRNWHWCKNCKGGGH